MTKKKAPGQPLPPPTAKPLVIPSDEPIDAVETRYGLVAVLYPPARGVCSSCRRRADRITQAKRQCPSCAQAA